MFKKQKTTTKKTIQFTYSLLKSRVYFMNKSWDLTNSNDVHFCFCNFIGKKSLLFMAFWRYSVPMVVQVIVIDLFNETVSFNHRGGHSPPRLLNRQSS